MQQDNIYNNEIYETEPRQENIPEQNEILSQEQGRDFKNQEPKDYNESKKAFVSHEELPKQFIEKTEIKKASKAIGIMMIAFLGLMFVLGIVMGIVNIFLGAFGQESIAFLNDPAVTQVQQILLSLLLFTVPFIFIARLSGYKISKIVPLGLCDKKTFLPLFLFGVSFCSFANIATSYAGSIFQSFGINYDVDFGDNPEGIYGFLLSLTAMVIVPALVEEFACRGIIMGILKKFGEGFAIISSAIIFGVMHSNFQQMPFAFLVGLVLGYIVVKSGSLWIAVAVHALNNFISIAFEYLLSSFSASVQDYIYMFYLIITLLSGIAALIMLKDNKDVYDLTPCDTECKEGKKYEWLFISPAIIIFIGVCVLESFAYFII